MVDIFKAYHLAQVIILEDCVADSRARQVGSVEEGSRKVGSCKIGPSENGIAEVRIA